MLQPSSTYGAVATQLNSLSRIDILRSELAREVGFVEYPHIRDAQPFLNYVENRIIATPSPEHYLELFKRVVEHCKADLRPGTRTSTTSQSSAGPTPSMNGAAVPSSGAQQEQRPTVGSQHGTPNSAAQQIAPINPKGIWVLIEELVESDSEPVFDIFPPNSDDRREFVIDTVLRILGLWTATLSDFTKTTQGYRRLYINYCVKQNLPIHNDDQEFLSQTFTSLLDRSGLFSPQIDLSLRPQNTEQGILHIISLLLSASKSPVPGVSSASDPGSLDQRLKDALTSYALVGSFAGVQSSTYNTIPSQPSFDILESESIKASALNAQTITSLSRIRIRWTYNVPRHLTVSHRAGQYELELFALPCLLKGEPSPLRMAGVSAELIQEILESYAILFNPSVASPLHTRLGSLIGMKWWCWCLGCSSQRLRRQEAKSLSQSGGWAGKQRSEFDPCLVELMGRPSGDWHREQFPHLWARIVALEETLQAARPWNFWVLFRDRRDTLQFWTFLFGTVILFLTLLQVLLGIAQVVGSF